MSAQTSATPGIGTALAALHQPFTPGKQPTFLSDLTVGELVLLAQRVAEIEGIDGEDRGYRLVMNVGPEGTMSVPHLHLHVLGGRQLGPSLG